MVQIEQSTSVPEKRKKTFISWEKYNCFIRKICSNITPCFWIPWFVPVVGTWARGFLWLYETRFATQLQNQTRCWLWWWKYSVSLFTRYPFIFHKYCGPSIVLDLWKPGTIYHFTFGIVTRIGWHFHFDIFSTYDVHVVCFGNCVVLILCWIGCEQQNASYYYIMWDDIHIYNTYVGFPSAIRKSTNVRWFRFKNISYSFVEYHINFRSYSQFVHDENLTKRGIFLLVYLILRIYAGGTDVIYKSEVLF